MTEKKETRNQQRHFLERNNRKITASHGDVKEQVKEKIIKKVQVYPQNY